MLRHNHSLTAFDAEGRRAFLIASPDNCEQPFCVAIDISSDKIGEFQVLWSVPSVPGMEFGVEVPPLVVDDLVICCYYYPPVDEEEGAVVALDASTGEERWRFAIKTAECPDDECVVSSLLLLHSEVYSTILNQSVCLNNHTPKGKKKRGCSTI